MGRMMIGAFNGVAIDSDATQDLWALMAASANKLILHGWEITSADTTAEIIACHLQRISATSTGTAVDEVNLDADDAAATGILLVESLTPGTPIANSVLAGFQWEQLGPLGQVYTPEMRPVIQESKGIALTCSTAAAITMSGWVCWEEF